MSQLRNFPEEKAAALSELISIRENQVVSMALTRGNGISMTLLAFAEGEDVSEEQYFGDTLYYGVEGEAVIRRGERDILLHQGEVVMVPAGTLHGVSGRGEFKILQITVNDK